VADFTSVLIDVRDNYIILPKPVNSRTVVVARLLHIFVHVIKIVLPLGLPANIFIAINYSVMAGILFFLLLLLCILMTIFLVNALYILILKITTPQKFQAVIGYFQILLAIFIYASYQILPRFLGNYSDRNIDLSRYKWVILLPPYWFSAAFATLQGSAHATIEYTGTALALLLPFISMYVVVRYLAPAFNQKLSMITSVTEESTRTERPVQAGNHNNTPIRKRYSEQMAGLFTHNGIERMGFLFTWRMTSRSKDFKMKVYPSVGYLFVYVIIMLMNKKNFSLSQIQSSETGSKILMLAVMYMFSLLLLTAIGQLPYSEKFKASWMYYTTPVAQPGRILAGMLKAILVRFYLPFILVSIIAAVALFGWIALPNFLLGTSNVILVTLVAVYGGHKLLPFSTYENKAMKGGSFIRALFRLIIIGVFPVLHYFSFGIWPLLLIFLALSVIANWMLYDSISKFTWQQVKTSNEFE
jgi:hypothetical protein